MVSSSILFIFTFLPIFLILYYLVPGRAKFIVLLIGSLIFYAWGSPVYTILLLFSCVFNYYMGRSIGRAAGHRRPVGDLIFTVAVNIGILCFFKYYLIVLGGISRLFGLSIAWPQLGLPLGISFYTFRNLSYVLDVYKGKIEPEENFLTFGVYSVMFPYMSAGPIVRYADIAESLQGVKLSRARFGQGCGIFIKGLAKKVILADNLALLYAALNGDDRLTVLGAWMAILTYTMQIYFDFSGYSDTAIGLGVMLGFDFPENFDYPYLSRSVTEFWRRWHISLGSWFRDYVYIPLGGNRVSQAAHIRNILIVWALTGIWHGSSLNFLLWGLFYGLILLLEKYVLQDSLENLPGPLANLYTMLMVILGWVFFSQTSLAGIGRMLGGMFIVGSSGLFNSAFFYYLRTGGILLVLAFIFCRPGPEQFFKRLARKNAPAAVVIDLALLLIATAFMVYNSYTPFMYAAF